MEEAPYPPGDPGSLIAKNLGRRIENRWLWQGVGFTLQPGARLGLVGPSGAGKTLLLRSLVKLDPLDQGTIEFQGRSLSQWSIPHYRTQVMYLPQRPALTEGTVETNLRAVFNLKVHREIQPQKKFIKRYQRDRVIANLELLGRNATFLSRPVSSLSGGESQILALLRVLQLEPLILLLDEPTAALDPEATQQFENLVNQWFEARQHLDQPSPHRAFIWTSHDPAQIQRVTTQQLNLGAFT